MMIASFASVFDALQWTLFPGPLHAGPHDPVAPDPTMSILLRLGVAAVAGLVAAVAVQVPVWLLEYGEVPADGAVALLTSTSYTDVSEGARGLALAGFGVLAGIVAQGVSIVLFGRFRIPIVEVPWIPLQTLTAGVVALLGLYGCFSYLVVPRVHEGVHSISAIRRHWLGCCLVFAGAFVVTEATLFVVLFA